MIQSIRCVAIACDKRSSASLTLRKYSGCQFYLYCSVACQKHHWKNTKHNAECKHLNLLRKYHKPYANEIRQEAIHGDLNFPPCQLLWNKLGLTWPIEDYNGLLKPDCPPDPFEYNIVTRKDRTFHIGLSVPNHVVKKEFKRGFWGSLVVTRRKSLMLSH
jgi:hypothetical protein